jgi:hypothetical protein
MPRSLNPFLIQLLTGEAAETHRTVELIFRNGQIRRWATTNLTIDGNNFSDGLISVSDIEETEDSSTDRAEVVIQNIDKAIGLDIKSGAVHFAQAKIGRFFKKGDVSEWREEFFGEAIPRSISEREAVIEIIDEMVAGSYCVGNWTLAPVCQLIFKSAECGYAGSETTCNKLLKGDCTKYGRTHRHVSETFPIVKNATAPTSIPPFTGVGGGVGLDDDALTRWKSGYDYAGYNLNYDA